MIYVIIALVLIALFFAAVYISYRITFYNSTKKPSDPKHLPDDEQCRQAAPWLFTLIDELAAIPCEVVYITADDGVRLAARYYHVADGAPIHIQCHGYRGNPIRDFCGGSQIAREMGHNHLIIDQRAHGMSGGHTITFGVKERIDVLRWVEYCCERFGRDVPIILSGVSMGAATVLMAAELDLPDNVVGITADCPYTSPEDIIKKVCRVDMKLPVALAYPLVKIGARIFGGFDLSASTAVKAVTNTNIPVILLHGERDNFVPCDMSREIYKACASRKELHCFSEAGHGLSFVMHTERYKSIFKSFLESVL